MIIGLAGISYYGESVQKQIWKDALAKRPEIMNLSDTEASSDVKLQAKAAMDETERSSKEKSVAQDIGSAICFLAAVGGGTVGCLFSARLLGDKKFLNEGDKLENLAHNLRTAIPFIAGGITQMYMLPTEYKTTAITNTKMRAALAGRYRDSDEVANELESDRRISRDRNMLTALYK